MGIPDSVLSSGNRRKVTEFVSEQLTNPEEYRARVERVYQDSEAESNDILEFTDGRVFERASRPQRVDGETVGRVWCFRDVTERKRLEERLSYQAFHDPLTGLPNRALFQDRLAHSAVRMIRAGGRLAVLFVDLDNLKAVNDSLGHAAGDAVLEAAAQAISWMPAGVRLGGQVGRRRFRDSPGGGPGPGRRLARPSGCWRPSADRWWRPAGGLG